MNIVIFGPPASGKGTQASYFADKFSFCHFVMSNFLKKEVKSGSELGKEIDEKLKNGMLVSNEILCDILTKSIENIYTSTNKSDKSAKNQGNGGDQDNVANETNKANEGHKANVANKANEAHNNTHDTHDHRINGIIFDGIPRTIEQAKFLTELLQKKNQKVDVFIHISVKDDLLIERMSSRYVCPICSLSKSSLAMCDKCNVQMEKRADDNTEVFKKRLKNYSDMFDEIKTFYEKTNVPVVKINGNLSIEGVRNEIENAVENIH